MVQGVSSKTYFDLSGWFKERVDEFVDSRKKNLLRIMKNIIEKEGYNIEKDIFKYVAKHLMGRVSPPTTIDGLPYESPNWVPLRSTYSKRKGKYFGLNGPTQRKWIYSGSLYNYLLGLNPTYWYGGAPKAKVDYNNDYIIYKSMFAKGRKAFRSGRQEKKIEYNEPLRPIIWPMEDFLFDEKLNTEINNLIEEYLETNYGENE